MPTVSGKWKWNDSPVISGSAAIEQNIDFVSDKTNCTVIHINDARVGRGNLGYDGNGFANKVVYGAELGNVWLKEEFKTMNFGETEQEVSEDFYTYLTANATTTKTVSSDNLARFKQKCDETYAAIGNIPTVSTELVNLGTLSTSGTLTTDQVTQIGTTTIGVTARASVNGVTRFYERVNISGTTAMLVSADDDALHVLTVNLSTRAYTLSDVELGGGGPEIPTPTTSDNGKVLGVTNGAYALQEANPDIPTPTTSDNGKVLGVANGVYALQEAGGGGGTQLYKHTITISSLSIELTIFSTNDAALINRGQIESSIMSGEVISILCTTGGNTRYNVIWSWDTREVAHFYFYEYSSSSVELSEIGTFTTVTDSVTPL